MVMNDTGTRPTYSTTYNLPSQAHPAANTYEATRPLQSSESRKASEHWPSYPAFGGCNG